MQSIDARPTTEEGTDDSTARLNGAGTHPDGFLEDQVVRVQSVDGKLDENGAGDPRLGDRKGLAHDGDDVANTDCNVHREGGHGRPIGNIRITNTRSNNGDEQKVGGRDEGRIEVAAG